LSGGRDDFKRTAHYKVIRFSLSENFYVPCNYSGSDVDMELKKSFFLNIQGQGQLTMLKYEDILAWINTSIDYSISCPL
jgi:hypothetical protein